MGIVRGLFFGEIQSIITAHYFRGKKINKIKGVDAHGAQHLSNSNTYKTSS